MAQICAAVTIATEDIPTVALERLACVVLVSPCHAERLHCAGSHPREALRLDPRTFSPPYAVVTAVIDLHGAHVAELLPGVLKRSRCGDDGKG